MYPTCINNDAVSTSFNQWCKRLAMASVLSLAMNSPPGEQHIHDTFGRPCSSVGSANSSGTVQHHRLRSLSGSSISSLTSLWAPPFRRHDESSLSRSSSSQNVAIRRISTVSDRRSASGSYSRRASFASILSLRLRSDPASGFEQSEARLLDVAESDSELPEASEDGASFVEEQVDDELETARQDAASPLVGQPADNYTSKEPDTLPEAVGLRRWMSTLRRRKQSSRPKVSPRVAPWKPHNDESQPSSPSKPETWQHRNTDSQGSSIAFVTAVKSATATIASVSIATLSRRNMRWRQGNQLSSLMSGSEPRPSIDSQRSVMDEAAKQRSRKRRQKLEELIRSEESYVADIKALSNVRYS